MQEITSWIIFILIIIGVYVAPRIINRIRKYNKRRKEEVQALLGVLSPKEDKEK